MITNMINIMKFCVIIHKFIIKYCSKESVSSKKYNGFVSVLL